MSETHDCVAIINQKNQCVELFASGRIESRCLTSEFKGSEKIILHSQYLTETILFKEDISNRQIYDVFINNTSRNVLVIKKTTNNSFIIVCIRNEKRAERIFKHLSKRSKNYVEIFNKYPFLQNGRINELLQKFFSNCVELTQPVSNCNEDITTSPGSSIKTITNNSNQTNGDSQSTQSAPLNANTPASPQLMNQTTNNINLQSAKIDNNVPSPPTNATIGQSQQNDNPQPTQLDDNNLPPPPAIQPLLLTNTTEPNQQNDNPQPTELANSSFSPPPAFQPIPSTNTTEPNEKNDNSQPTQLDDNNLPPPPAPQPIPSTNTTEPNEKNDNTQPTELDDNNIPSPHALLLTNKIELNTISAIEDNNNLQLSSLLSSDALNNTSYSTNANQISSEQSNEPTKVPSGFELLIQQKSNQILTQNPKKTNEDDKDKKFKQNEIQDKDGPISSFARTPAFKLIANQHSPNNGNSSNNENCSDDDNSFNDDD